MRLSAFSKAIYLWRERTRIWDWDWAVFLLPVPVPFPSQFNLLESLLCLKSIMVPLSHRIKFKVGWHILESWGPEQRAMAGEGSSPVCPMLNGLWATYTHTGAWEEDISLPCHQVVIIHQEWNYKGGKEGRDGWTNYWIYKNSSRYLKLGFQCVLLVWN